MIDIKGIEIKHNRASKKDRHNEFEERADA